MSPETVKILLTGLPGCGKTTAIMQILEKLKDKKIVGFYTQEIREGNTRKGFSFNRLDGYTGILAHTNIQSSYRVGKYRVNLEEFEKVVVPILNAEETDAEIFIIDEIGKMECFSAMFVEAVKKLFKTERSVLATVALKGSGLISDIKNHQGVKSYNLTEQNRDKTTVEILQILSAVKNTP